MSGVFDPILFDPIVFDTGTIFPPGPAVYVDGVNITATDDDRVLFATARFMSAVNGVAGTCYFRARDLAGVQSYVPGAPIELVIDGQPVWTGYVSSVKRVYVFPALNVDEFGPTRFFDIEGVDLNILFTKRIVFNQTTPEDILAPLYGPNTPDTDAITDLLADWLDLSGDVLDTSTGVTGVGDINEDQDARAWEGSDNWGQAMQGIASLPAAIYYLRPNRQLAYVDDDTPDAPFGLSDVPDGVTTKGYREMEVLLDGTNLANDVLCWGAGYGSQIPVFTRAEDATSQTDHGLWQLGQVSFGVFKQATIDRIADSILNGSPDHRRGAKDDREAVTIVTYEKGLLPAQKVPFESQVFGYAKTLPIRKMEVTFPAPDKPRYELTLSREIDTPWSFFDPFRLNWPGFRFPGWPRPQLPPRGDDCGLDILHVGEHIGTDSNGRNSNVDFGFRASNGIVWTFRIKFDEDDRSVGGETAMAFRQNGPLAPTNYGWDCEIRYFAADAGTRLLVRSNVTTDSSTIYMTGKQGEWLTVKVTISGHVIEAKMWLDQSETEPVGYQVSATGSDSGSAVLDPTSAAQFLTVGGGPFFPAISDTFWNLIDVPGVGSETFNRTVLGGWENSEFSGTPAWTNNTGSGSLAVVTITDGTPCLPLMGPLCEIATRIDGTHYQVGRAILPGSARASIGGLILVVVTDFSENTAAQGIVEFVASVGLTDVVTICYIADGLVTP